LHPYFFKANWLHQQKPKQRFLNLFVSSNLDT
jgi:hypothetical protein